MRSDFVKGIRLSLQRIFRVLPQWTLPVALVAVAITIGTVEIYPANPASQRTNEGALNGQVGATKSGGEVVPPQSSTVYVLFSSVMQGGSFSHANDVDTAGGQFRWQLNNLLDKNKELKSLEKSARQNPRPEAANQIAAYYLQSVDDALAQVRNWLTKHPDRAWQMKTVEPDGKGSWSAEGLKAGGYEVVVRGKLSGYDADWEASVDLAPGRVISLPLTQPRFFRHE
jgi:hypothetical protein